MPLGDTDQSEDITPPTKYTPKDIRFLMDAWKMVQQMHTTNKKELQKHILLFLEVQQMISEFGWYAFHTVCGMQTPKHIETEIQELIFSDHQYSAMETVVEKLGVPKKHSKGLIDSFIQTELLGEREELERGIFGKTIEEILAPSR